MLLAYLLNPFSIEIVLRDVVICSSSVSHSEKKETHVIQQQATNCWATTGSTHKKLPLFLKQLIAWYWKKHNDISGITLVRNVWIDFRLQITLRSVCRQKTSKNFTTVSDEFLVHLTLSENTQMWRNLRKTFGTLFSGFVGHLDYLHIKSRSRKRNAREYVWPWNSLWLVIFQESTSTERASMLWMITSNLIWQQKNNANGIKLCKSIIKQNSSIHYDLTLSESY